MALSIMNRSNSLGYFNDSINTGIYNLHVDSSAADTSTLRKRSLAAISTGWVLADRYINPLSLPKIDRWAMGTFVRWLPPMGSHQFEFLGAIETLRMILPKLAPGRAGAKPVVFLHLDNLNVVHTINQWRAGSKITSKGFSIPYVMGILNELHKDVEIFAEWEKGHDAKNPENYAADKLASESRKEVELYGSLKPLHMHGIVARAMRNNKEMGKYYGNFERAFFSPESVSKLANIENSVVIVTDAAEKTDACPKIHRWAISSNGDTQKQFNIETPKNTGEANLETLAKMVVEYKASKHFHPSKTVYISGTNLAKAQHPIFMYLNGSDKTFESVTVPMFDNIETIFDGLRVVMLDPTPKGNFLRKLPRPLQLKTSE